MGTRDGIKTALLIFASMATLASCQNERLRVNEQPLYGPGAPHAQQSELVPGQPAAHAQVELEVNEGILAEGQRLYTWYNCGGCHFNGGGGIGPPLMDDAWIYGAEPQNIADTIINGRPQGMPSYGGRMPAAHIGPVVAYVRSLGGLGPIAGPTPTPVPTVKTRGQPPEDAQKSAPTADRDERQP